MDRYRRGAQDRPRPAAAPEPQRLPAEARQAAEVLFDVLMSQKTVMQAVAKELGLTLQQLAALRYLVPEEGIPMSALSDALSCDAANITGIVDKLEARGLVKRAPSQDRRVKLLKMTPPGARLHAKMMARLHEATPWITVLSREDQRLLRDILRRGLAGSRSQPTRTSSA
ncbi:MAG TPA: MarR family transcriptional regulator [bacterium]|nr:MarR family transcriptional regulator [bacterium]